MRVFIIFRGGPYRPENRSVWWVPNYVFIAFYKSWLRCFHTIFFPGAVDSFIIISDSSGYFPSGFDGNTRSFVFFVLNLLVGFVVVWFAPPLGVMAPSVIGGFGNAALRSGDFNVPHSAREATRPERAWPRNLPVYVNALGFIKLLQTPPIFQVDDGAGMTRRAGIYAVKYNSNLRHDRTPDVTNVLPGRRGYAGGFWGVAIDARSDTAKPFIREN